MSNQENYETAPEYYNPVPAETYDTSLARTSESAPVAAGNMSNRAMRKLESRMEMEAANMQAFGRLSGELIMNTVAIPALGEQAVKNAPGAQKQIEHIINVYAAASAHGLAERWSLWHR